MVIDHRKGLYVPRLSADKCSECSLCLDVCPGHAVDFTQLARDVFGTESTDATLGSYVRCYMGHATNHDIRYNSASGGLTTALLIYALDEGLIDGALVTKMREDRPLEPQPFIARTRGEIVAAARSKYCPVPANVALTEVLEAKDGERFAVVGLPCHIQGVRKAELISRKLRERIVLHLGVVCSHSDSFLETDSLLKRYGIRKADVAGLEYRGRGWPGYMTIRTRQGSEESIPFHEYIRLHENYFFTPRRCTLCCDMSARLSDIALMDAWLPEVRAQDNVGSSLLISRTERGEALCRSARAKQVVDLEEIPSSEVIRSQGRSRMSNKDLKAHIRFSKLYHGSVPNYTIDVPRSGPKNYLRALVIHLNIWVSSGRSLRCLINPLLLVESRMFKLAKSRS